MRKFDLGQLVVTRTIMADMEKSPLFQREVNQALSRYIACDWGETAEDDKPLNVWAVEHGDRILAAYETYKGRIWIITEWDRSATTVLYPSEY